MSHFSFHTVCCLVTSHCPAHFKVLISLETMNKSMACFARADGFWGKVSPVLLSSLLGASGPEPGCEHHPKREQRQEHAPHSTSGRDGDKLT